MATETHVLEIQEKVAFGENRTLDFIVEIREPYKVVRLSASETDNRSWLESQVGVLNVLNLRNLVFILDLGSASYLQRLLSFFQVRQWYSISIVETVSKELSGKSEYKNWIMETIGDDADIAIANARNDTEIFPGSSAGDNSSSTSAELQLLSSFVLLEILFLLMS